MSITIEADPVPLRTDADGVVRIGGTRVTLDVVIEAFKEGATAEGICCRYPTVDLADVYAAIGYYLRRRDDVEEYLREGRRQAEGIQKEIEKRLDPQGVRERLLARQAKRGGQDACSD